MVQGCGLSLQVRNGAVSLDGQDGVGLGHVHRVLDVGCAAVLQLDFLQTTLVICICRKKEEKRKGIKTLQEVKADTVKS